jgi:Mg2+/Co2+ transporter CorB
MAFSAAYLLAPLLKISYPLVWVINGITNTFLRIFGINVTGDNNHHLSTEELRTLVNEAGALLPQNNQSMLLGVLELSEVTVNDIMIPRNEVMGIDLDDDIDTIIGRLSNTEHTRLPVYQGELNKVVGILHMRNLAQVFHEGKVTKAAILQVIREPYFVPESTPLETQLVHFQSQNRRIGLVVDEYGDIQGIVTLEDILEEIVGELSSSPRDADQDIFPQEDGSYYIEGSAYIRDVNKALDWNLPTDGPKTMNGLITETLESIPEANVCLQLMHYRIETLQVSDNVIKTARIIAFKKKQDD